MIKLLLNNNLVIFLRLFCIGCTILFSFKFTAYSLFFIFLSFVALYLVDKKKIKNFKIVNVSNQLENPLKNLKKSNINEIPEEIQIKTKNELFEYFFNDYSRSESLSLFEAIKNKSECIFSKRADLWGSNIWNEHLTIEENINNMIPSFILFCNFCTNLKLDGYLLHVSSKQYGTDLDTFAKTFYQILKILSINDPKRKNCIQYRIDSPSWVFEFSRITFFISTFLPVYNRNHSRFTHGIDECFILFQPEVSFLIKNIPFDTPLTNWNEPKTVRDKIRIAFKNANKKYLIRETIRYPMAFDMIKPLNDDEPIIKWWNLQ